MLGTGGPMGRQAGLPLASPGIMGGSWTAAHHVTSLELQLAALNPNRLPQVQGEATCWNVTGSSRDPS